jgi:hypothetical protein
MPHRAETFHQKGLSERALQISQYRRMTSDQTRHVSTTCMKPVAARDLRVPSLERGGERDIVNAEQALRRA